MSHPRLRDARAREVPNQFLDALLLLNDSTLVGNAAVRADITEPCDLLMKGVFIAAARTKPPFPAACDFRT